MKNEVEVKIYVLYNPRDCKVRYIGRTTKKVLSHRLAEHLSKARYEHLYYPGKKSSYKNTWLKSLFKDGIEPRIKLITTVQGWAESHDVEKHMIAHHKTIRNLTNYTDKGMGVLDNYVSSETRLKISDTLKGFYSTTTNNRAKKVHVYDLTGSYIATYESATAFAEYLNVIPRHVTRVASGNYGRRQLKGYQIVYEGSPPPESLTTIKRASYVIEKTRKKLFLQHRLTGEITSYFGINELCKEIGVPRHKYYNSMKKASTFDIGIYTLLPGPV
jgi:hypothetical protein